MLASARPDSLCVTHCRRGGRPTESLRRPTPRAMSLEPSTSSSPRSPKPKRRDDVCAEPRLRPSRSRHQGSANEPDPSRSLPRSHSPCVRYVLTPYSSNSTLCRGFASRTSLDPNRGRSVAREQRRIAARQVISGATDAHPPARPAELSASSLALGSADACPVVALLAAAG